MQYTKWREYRNTLLTPDERAVIEAKVNLISDIIKARQAKGLSQKQLENASSIKQPVIARLEKGKTNPQLETIIKLLLPLGLKLSIEPIE